MKLIRQSRLFFQQGNSDKIYEVDLCDVSTAYRPNSFVVNFRYGRRGRALREGTKTLLPVDRAEADKLYDSLVVSKLNKGYLEQSASTNTEDVALQPVTSDSTHSVTVRYEGAFARVQAGFTEIASNQLNEKAASRIVWRAGEIGSAQFVPPLLKLLDSSKGLLQYAVLWSLGRCGDETVFDTISAFVDQGDGELNQRVALWAAWQLASNTQGEPLFNSVQGKLPSSLFAVVDADEQLVLNAALDEFFSTDSINCNDALHNLYLLSHQRENLRRTLLRTLSLVPLKPNYFRGVRQVYKAAEFFRDAEIFGLLNRRFDLDRSFYTAPVYGDHVAVQSPRFEYVRVSKQHNRPDARLAYSSKTRNYLRHRTWRSLRRLGELGLDDYVEMAMGVMLAYRGEHKRTAKQSSYYIWDDHTSRSHTKTIYYDEYADFICLNYILHRRGERYLLAGSRQAWQVNPGYSGSQTREDAFPELWDRHPDALLNLMRESDLDAVQEFACNALKENSDFCAQLSLDVLISFLQSPFSCTVEFSFNIAKERYDPAIPNVQLVFALLDSSHEPAVSLAKEWVNANPSAFSGSTEFMLAVITARTQEIRRWARLLLDAASHNNAASIVEAVFDWLLQRSQGQIDSSQINDVQWALLNPLKTVSASLPFEQILALLVHPAPEIQVVAGRLLVNHERPAEDVPVAVFTRLLESPVAEVRGVGVELFAQLPDEAIVRQPELVESFCVADEAQVRTGIRPAIARLSAGHPEFARVLTRKLIDRLFLRENVDGLHNDLVSLLTNELATHSKACSKELNWRLLQARSNAAQALGSWLLPNRAPRDYTVRQWAALGRHSDVITRHWAWQCYLDLPDLIVAETNDALRILDSDWEDSRQFAFSYFRENFPADAWRPELMISICDSVRDDVQTFGRELITRFFDEQHGEEYLLKLSQHPSTNVQLFASNYLERYASGDISRIAKLELYFVTVLSQVNRNRVCKNRITRFLLREAKKTEDVAMLVARVFTRQSVTMAIADKATYLSGMRDLTRQYPHIQMPLTIVTPPLYGARVDSDDKVVHT